MVKSRRQAATDTTLQVPPQLRTFPTQTKLRPANTPPLPGSTAIDHNTTVGLEARVNLTGIGLLALHLTADNRRYRLIRGLCSRRRLGDLAKEDVDTSLLASSTPLVSARSVQALRNSIRRLERQVEVGIASVPEIARQTSPNADRRQHAVDTTTPQLLLKDSQLRMSIWLNRLPIKRYITWFPEVANSHAVIIVR
jgi:hypothetical protein